MRTQLSLVKLLDAICSSMVQKENWEEICGDLHAVRIIGQTGGFPKSTKENLKRSLQCVLQKSKDFASEAEGISMSIEKNHSSSEESPPKKRRIDATQLNKTNQVIEEKSETPAEPPTTSEEKDEKVPLEVKEEVKIEAEVKESEKAAAVAVTTSLTSVTTSSTSTLVSTRNDLIKDIESHIEIIYECLDELNESGSTSSVNKAAGSETTDPSDTLNQEAPSEDSEAKPSDTTAQDESRND